ncbi:MAG: M28 family peptidase, partial [Cyclobacteriaceae bacterium]|nr:M28 family peptidase [Cyclobacteriaceae bacterium]
MKNFVRIMLITCIPILGYSQTTEVVVKYAQTILEDDLSGHLSILASDALEGRETGKRGQKMAATYIKEHFKKLGLKGPAQSDCGEGYYQTVPLYVVRQGEVYLSVQGKRFENFNQMVFDHGNNSNGEQEIEIVFAGGGTADEISRLDIKGKGVLVVTENFNGVIPAIFKAGARLVIVQAGEGMDVFNRVRNYFKYTGYEGELSLEKPGEGSEENLFFVTPEVSESIFGLAREKIISLSQSSMKGNKGALKKVNPSKIRFSIEQTADMVTTENVLGYLEGTDKKDELVVLTAHYDHEGTNGEEVFNGADDDGSGTVTILELAEAFAKAKEEGNGPRRSILFMTVSGEEKGLLGSKYYTDHPIFSLDNTVVDLNIDMVGR